MTAGVGAVTVRASPSSPRTGGDSQLNALRGWASAQTEAVPRRGTDGLLAVRVLEHGGLDEAYQVRDHLVVAVQAELTASVRDDAQHIALRSIDRGQLAPRPKEGHRGILNTRHAMVGPRGTGWARRGGGAGWQSMVPWVGRP